MSVIEKMHAIATGEPAAGWMDQGRSFKIPDLADRNNPGRVNQQVLLDVLMRLEVVTVSASAANALLVSGHKFSSKEIGNALSKADVPMADRFRLKKAMERCGILGS